MIFQNDLESSFCCLNSSHSLTFHGNCKNKFEYLNTNQFNFIPNNKCLGRDLQFNSFVKDRDCVIQISYLTMCFDSNIIDKDCDFNRTPCSFHYN